MRQVVADDVLDDLAAGLDDLARWEHRLEPQHVLLGRAVLERARPAGALGDVPADDGLPQRRRVRRIEEPDLLDGVLEIAGDDVGFDDGDEVGFVDLEDAVHPLERDHDAAPRRDRPAGVAGAAAPRHHRHPVFGAQPDNRRDLRGVPGSTTMSAGMPALERIGAVDRARLLVGADVLRTECRLELGEDVGGQRGTKS